MMTKVRKWGNSQGLRLPKPIMEESRISIGDEVKISAEHGRIVIEPVRRRPEGYDIHQLAAQMPADYQPAEVDWGVAQGKEEW